MTRDRRTTTNSLDVAPSSRKKEQGKPGPLSASKYTLDLIDRSSRLGQHSEREDLDVTMPARKDDDLQS
jgi:hypothetical protein